MDTWLRFFQYIPSVLGLLVSGLVFLGGLILGLLFSWLFKKRADKKPNKAIVSLQSELRNLDSEIGKLWAMRFSPEHRRVPVDGIKTHANGNSLIIDLLNIRIVLEALRGNIVSIVHSLETPPADGFGPQKNLQGSSEKPEVVLNGSPLDRPSSSVVQDLESQRPIRNQAARSSARSLIEVYNQAVNDPLARERFREDFSPIRIGTVNAVERRQNPTIKAEIRETTDGDFFALRIDETNDFVVFPRLGLTIEAVTYAAGAMGEVFDKTREHNPKLFYSRYRVKQPAIFRLEGDRWQLREPGELELGIGE